MQQAADREVYLAGRHVGRLIHDKRRFLTYRRPEHIFQLYDAFGLNASLLDQLVEMGYSIRIIYEGGLTAIYDVDAKHWKEKGQPYNNVGEKQIMLTRSELKLVMRQLPPEPKRAPEVVA